MNATPRPWKMQEDGTTYKRWNIVSEDTAWGLIAHIRGPRTHPEVSENAKLIVRAVNSFDAMREALEAVAHEWERTECPLDHLGPQAPDWIRRVKTALALAKGER